MNQITKNEVVMKKLSEIEWRRVNLLTVQESLVIK